MKQVLTSVVFVFGFAAVGFGAVDGSTTTRPEEGVDIQNRAQLYSLYRTCSDEADRRVLDQQEVLACASIYLQLKLSFLEDVTPESYAQLDAADRARANREGYAAYQDWVQWRVIGLK